MPGQSRPRGKETTPPRESAEALLPPTVSVQKVGVKKEGMVTTYTFKIRTSHDVVKGAVAVGAVSYQEINGSAFAPEGDFHYEYYGDMPAGTVRLISFVCHPPSGTYCSGAWVRVMSSNAALAWAVSTADGNK